MAANKKRRDYLKKLQKAETRNTKVCSACENILPLSTFNRNKTQRKGRQTTCRECSVERHILSKLSKEEVEARKARVSRLKRIKSLRERETDQIHLCCGCMELKLVACFSFDSSKRSGLSNACKDCERNSKLLYTYGISLRQYDEMLTLQDGKCAICGTDTPDHYGRFVVDHCHASGDVRALLCSHCNVVLGMAGDNPEVLEAASCYLRKHNETKVL